MFYSAALRRFKDLLSFDTSCQCIWSWRGAQQKKTIINSQTILTTTQVPQTHHLITRLRFTLLAHNMDPPPSLCCLVAAIHADDLKQRLPLVKVRKQTWQWGIMKVAEILKTDSSRLNINQIHHTVTHPHLNVSLHTKYTAYLNSFNKGWTWNQKMQPIIFNSRCLWLRWSTDHKKGSKKD